MRSAELLIVGVIRKVSAPVPLLTAATMRQPANSGAGSGPLSAFVKATEWLVSRPMMPWEHGRSGETELGRVCVIDAYAF